MNQKKEFTAPTTDPPALSSISSELRQTLNVDQTRSFPDFRHHVLMIFFTQIYAFLNIRRMCSAFILAVALLSCPQPSHASEGLQIAVAANFMIPFKEIATAFRGETKIDIIKPADKKK